MEIVSLILGGLGLLITLSILKITNTGLILSILGTIFGIVTILKERTALGFIAVIVSIVGIVLSVYEPAPEQTSKYDKDGTQILNVGDTWTVEGQWKLTVHSVKATDERNQFVEGNPTQAVVVTYSYENLGYTDTSGIMNGLYIDLSPSGNSVVTTETGELAYSYVGTISKFPEAIPIGAKCENAQSGIGLDSVNKTLKMTISKHDVAGKEQRVIYNLDIK